jgi:hypothetical protein
MKALDKAKYDAILADVTNLINIGQRALNEIKSIIQSDSSTAFKNKYNNLNDENNLFFYTWKSLKNGYEGVNDGANLKPGSPATITKIKAVYAKIKAIENAGEGTPRYPVTTPRDGGIIVQVPSEVFVNIFIFDNVFATTKLNDVYGNKAITDYMFRVFLKKETFDASEANIYVENAARKTGVNNFVKVAYRDSLAGSLAALRAIKDKLQNFEPGADNFTATPEADAVEDANSVVAESQFKNFMAEAGIGFNLESEVATRYPGVLRDDPRLDKTKKSFYRIFAEDLNNIDDNNKYVKNIWNRIKLSGLLELALQVNSISDFARKRFSVGTNLTVGAKGTIANAIDPIRDTMWLNDLTNAITNLSRDPITLAVIQKYFPNLITLFFNAIAAAADYNPSAGSQDDPINNPDELAKSLLRAFGTDKDGKPIFQAAWAIENTGQKIRKALEQFPFRENIPPKTPDIFHFRLGAANFYVPPISIEVNSQFKTGSLTGGAIRQKSSPKFNAGYKQTSINLKLFFPNYEEIWGITIDGIKEVKLTNDFKIDFKVGGESEEKIDKFLSSLRGLIAAFKYAPILPVKNHYLNTVHGITGVALSSMSISTIPNYPFAVVVDLELLNFNHKPFLPMIKDFNQAVHWGKYRHYMGKAAGSLHSYVNASFFMEKAEPDATTVTPASLSPGLANYSPGLTQDGLTISNSLNPVPPSDSNIENIYEPDLLTNPFTNDVFNTNVIKEWKNGNNISLFIPAQTQSKLFTPDTSSFRSSQEREMEDLGGSFWDARLKSLGIDINQSSKYHRDLDSVVETSIEGSVAPNARKLVLNAIELIVAGAGAPILSGPAKIVTIGDGTKTSFVIPHNFNTKEVSVTVVEAASPNSLISTAWEATSNRSIKVTFDSAPAANSIKVSIKVSEYNERIYAYLVTSFIIENKNKFNQNEINYLRVAPAEKDKIPQHFTTRAQVYKFKSKNLILERQGQPNQSYNLQEVRILFEKSSKGTESYLDSLALQDATEKSLRTGLPVSKFLEDSEKDIGRAFTVLFYNRFFKSGPMQDTLEKYRLSRSRSGDGGMFGNGVATFNEWEVPMIKVDLDPKSVIVNGVSVTLGNNLAKMQLQMQEEPTYQHIGGKDTYLNISMTIFGEKELIKIRNVFEHINGLARLEHAAGVIGFMGIKNIIAGLAGMKYVMPLSYEVNTIPNFPHVYDVKMSFVDFDIFQQQREQLSSKQQQEMVDVFKTKKNPFLRIKQLWGAFNAYPDFPLTIKDDLGEVVGCLDPDYYFRSFEMFDRDIINNITVQTEKNKDFIITPKKYNTQSSSEQAKADVAIMNAIKDFVKNDKISELKKYFEEQGIGARESVSYVEGAIKQFFNNEKKQLIIDYIKEFPEIDGTVAIFGSEYEIGSNATGIELKAGDIVSSDQSKIDELNSYLSGAKGTGDEEGYISFNPDNLGIHHVITLLPAQENTSEDKVPAMFTTAMGYHLGYMSKQNNKFYLTIDGVEVTKSESTGQIGYRPIPISHQDVDSPSKSYSPGQKTHTGVAGSTPADYADPYSSGSADKPEVMATKSKVPSTTKHWEKMLIDTQYRDISGRMLRAFPTYMLWLIDEGGYFAGVKLFDNFYGLQSIIDFSIVQSEDILGDTLMLRVSNLYSKLTTPASNSLFDKTDESYNDQVSTQDGMDAAIANVLNRSMNLQNHMDSTFVVDINNIRLKPGVRVHLRAGYGSNPNSLQTVFNGVITQVENGEIVTITAQSDAIELSPIVNSTNKKGDSGKIDGGINTGFWLSEPRDLMVRLLSMGSSRSREALAHATRGTIFSENKFGIRHFGSILYQPLNDLEQAKNDAVTASVKDAFESLGDGSGNLFGGGSVLGVLSSGTNDGEGSLNGIGPEIRVPGVSLMKTLWANFSTQRDFEIFKRNIYPGNGTGIAQFLGGDLGDGWSTIASLTPEDKPNERINYIGRATDVAWNNLTTVYGQGNQTASSVMDAYNVGNELRNSNGSASLTSGIISGGIVIAGVGVAALGAPVFGAAIGLTGVLSGRGGANIFNAMGITSGMDDDLPGLDEVSFRAQTYMRSVWDLFQTCARLLPNYIVAIRPFEDRSTVFYGKPHWLYTSGVVPLTAGFDTDQRAQEAGINYPRMVDIDQNTQEIINSLNKESNPFADAEAFRNANQTLVPIDTILGAQGGTSGNIELYAPGKKLAGRLVAFGVASSIYYKKDGKVVSKLPSDDGYATVGYHLPITGNGTDNAVDLSKEQLAKHKQIDQLPYRYRFPFFTDREDGIVLEDYAYYALSNQLGKWNNHRADYMTLAVDDWAYGTVGGEKEETEWIKLLKLEASIFTGINTVDTANTRNANEVGIGLKFKLSATLSFNNELEDASAYIYSEKNKSTGSFNVIRMPYPDLATSNAAVINAADREYSIIKSTINRQNNAASILEWGSPMTALEEQFYIAMRWPYNPGEGLNDWSVENFKLLHNITDTYGSVQDYKSRKVLVYSPTTGIAVVCKPAYFLWGDKKVSILAPTVDSDAEDADLRDGIDEFGNTVKPKTESGGSGGNALGLGLDVELDAIVSPDAAYFLGMLNLTANETTFWQDGDSSKSAESWHGAETAIINAAKANIAPFPVPRKCLYAFVPDDTPLGVVPDVFLPAKEFERPSDLSELVKPKKIIGFGSFKGNKSIINPKFTNGKESYQFTFDKTTSNYTTAIEVMGSAKLAGNIMGPDGLSENGYFDLVKGNKYSKLSRDSLKAILDQETADSGEGKEAVGRKRFVGVYTETDMVSIDARKLYDEDFDQTVSVLAGDGRTLQEAADVWDQFRFGYHTYTNVKEAFQNAYGLDPDSEEKLTLLGSLGAAIGTDTPPPDAGADTTGANSIFKKYGDTGESAEDEFTAVFGEDFFATTTVSSIERSRGATGISGDKIKQALDLSRQKFIDGSIENDGLIEYFNDLVSSKVQGIKTIISDGIKLAGVDPEDYLGTVETPKQLFLYLVGAFRNTMWSDPYARAWLVLKPNRKMRGQDLWDFNPVLKIFQAYIDPNSTYGKDAQKFRKLLAENRGEGSSATNIVGKATEEIDGFWDANIGPLFTALGDSLSGLINLFRMSMMQLGYGLSQVGQMSKQANILNKALNDSIYYSLGRPGSLLRAVDNPFTREYGEPVVEIREPFQRMHYISSFSHIISNGIQENIAGVATSVTAVSDGKYPVTVAMDKSTPSERQVEKTVETGLYYDNVSGSGLFGALQPILHPFEFARGISKFAQGTPDELSARRVALAHLKESLKDMYGGEIVVVGNADIRPHDLVYLADVYERMYGMFEVEQVVHHFTSELGFITSITPNALVTVNDPSRWFMSSWVGTWFHMQALRNDTRLYMNSLGSGVTASAQVSVDGLASSLQTQMVGGIQYTHGASSIAKDAMASFAAEGFQDINDNVRTMVSSKTNNPSAKGGVGSMFAAMTGLGATATAIATLAVPGGGALLAGGAALIGASAGGGLAWKGWSWIRDNVLDQHGCYIQYLNKNGQAMDAGLNQSGQGMVVGRYATKKLLPGILGVSTKVRTVEGYSYIRTDDLLKNLGWREKEINDLTRYISLENALVNAQVLKYSGIGPEKTGLNRFFKVICKVSNVLDGDTIDVIDIFDKAEVPFRVRFDGIDTPELAIVKSNTDTLPPKTVNVKSIKIKNNIMFIKFDLTLKEFSDLVDSPSNYFQGSDENDGKTGDKVRISIPNFNGSPLTLDGTIAINGKQYETIKDTTTITPSFANGVQRFKLSSSAIGSDFYVGSRVKIYNKNSPEVNWMEGVVTQVDSNPGANDYGISVNVDKKSGTTASAVYSVSNRLFLNGYITIPYRHADVQEKNYTGNVTVYSYKSTEFKLNTSPGGASTLFTLNAIKDKIIVLRVNPDTKKITAIVGEDDFEAGAQKNTYVSYGKDIYGSRVLGTIFYKTTQKIIDSLSIEINNLFTKNKSLSDADIKLKLKDSFYDGIFQDRFTEIYDATSTTSLVDYYKLYAASKTNFISTTNARIKIYNTYFTMRVIRDIYQKVSDWPNIAWDEYYDDGTPASLNWELVVNNLAKVYTSGLLVEQPSINTATETLAIGRNGA